MKKIINKNTILGLIVGIIISGVTVYAVETKYKAEDVKYKETTVKAALDDLYSKNNKEEVYNKLFNNNKYLLKNGTQIKKDSNGNYYFDFDGVDDYIQLATIPESVNFSDGFTIEFKAKWDAFNKWSRIFDFGNGFENYNLFVATYNTTNKLAFSSREGSKERFAKTEVVELNSNSFSIYKIEIIKKSENNYNVKFYKDNELVNEFTESAMFPNVERINNYIGKSNFDADAYFDGQIYYLKIKQADGISIVDVDANDIFK